MQKVCYTFCRDTIPERRCYFTIKAHSHHKLGKYLAQHYLPDAPRRYIFAFLLGCTEPDKNPATYLKGSLANRWLRGHNWESSRRYMRRLSIRLENRKKLRLLDFYAMGKLIHYVTDAFTFSHNRGFTQNLLAHRHYEQDLEAFFLAFLRTPAGFCPVRRSMVMDIIQNLHREYTSQPPNIRKDSLFAVSACSTVVHLLLSDRVPYYAAPSLQG